MTPGRYYRLLLQSKPKNFQEVFLSHWKEHLASLPPQYRGARQIAIGARFRPFLVAWGYILSDSTFTQSEMDKVAKLSIYIELLHKATLLIDDLIDDDSVRRGEESFHIEYSKNEAVLFGIYLLGDSLNHLISTLSQDGPERNMKTILNLLSDAVREMSTGAIEEMTLSNEDLLKASKVKRLIELQTIALIKNGLLVGYEYGEGKRENIETIGSLGFDCGYLFQVLNDLEPFLGAKANANHKGIVNFDITRSRKNIAAAMLFEQLGPSEREEFERLRDRADASLEARLRGWFVEYRVLEMIEENLMLARDNLQRNSEILRIEPQRVADFRLFQNFVLRSALDRFSGHYRGRLSEILIM